MDGFAGLWSGPGDCRPSRLSTQPEGLITHTFKIALSKCLALKKYNFTGSLNSLSG